MSDICLYAEKIPLLEELGCGERSIVSEMPAG